MTPVELRVELVDQLDAGEVVQGELGHLVLLLAPQLVSLLGPAATNSGKCTEWSCIILPVEVLGHPTHPYSVHVVGLPPLQARVDSPQCSVQLFDGRPQKGHIPRPVGGWALHTRVMVG